MNSLGFGRLCTAMGNIVSRQGWTSCGYLISGLWGFFWFQKLKKTVDWGLWTHQQTMHFCCRKAKNGCFAPKALIYGICVANVAKAQGTRFEDKIFAMRTSRKLCNPVSKLQFTVAVSALSKGRNQWRKKNAFFRVIVFIRQPPSRTHIWATWSSFLGKLCMTSRCNTVGQISQLHQQVLFIQVDRFYY